MLWPLPLGAGVPVPVGRQEAEPEPREPWQDPQPSRRLAAMANAAQATASVDSSRPRRCSRRLVQPDPRALASLQVRQK